MSKIENLVWDWTYVPWFFLSILAFFGLFTQLDKLSERFSTSFRSFSDKTKITWHTYLYSIVHALIVSSLSVYALCTDADLWNEPILHNSPIVRITCAVCSGYMIFDLCVMITHLKHIGDWFFVFHHLTTVYAYFIVVIYGVFPFFAIYRLLAELSTPFVDLRWFIDVLGYPKSSPQNMINGVLMTLSFFLVRILVMPHYWYIVYSTYGTEDCNSVGHMLYILLSSCIVLDFINIVWFYKMCRGVKKVLILFFSENKVVKSD